MRSARIRKFGTVAAVALSATVLGVSASAAAVVDPAPIGAHQWFTGQVNGAASNAVIKVVCPGPATPGQSGHPVSGQTVDVLPASGPATTGTGYTGEAADHIAVGFGTPAATGPTTLSSYAVKAAIPTSILLPCSGTGKVAFVPAPTSPTAVTATVTVTYVNIAV
jgi:hypothetical protein